MKTFLYFNSLFVCFILFLTITVPQSIAEDKDKLNKNQVTYPKVIEEVNVPQYLQDIAVTIRATSEYGFGTSEGSGVLKVTKDGQVWIWTCGHVVQQLRTERKNSDGKTVVDFNDAKVIKVLVEDGRKVGELSFDAEVIRYSDANHGDDLALLRMRSKQYKPSASVVFYDDEKIPAIGTKLLHCGSLLGQMGSNSLTSGILSQHGRVFNNVVFDQTTCAAFPGSSGGVVSLEKDGRYIGMVVRGSGETFNLIVPVRRIKKWAYKTDVAFALDDSIEIPTDEALKKKPIDDSLKSELKPDKVNNKHFQTLELYKPFLKMESIPE